MFSQCNVQVGDTVTQAFGHKIAGVDLVGSIPAIFLFAKSQNGDAKSQNGNAAALR